MDNPSDSSEGDVPRIDIVRRVTLWPSTRRAFVTTAEFALLGAPSPLNRRFSGSSTSDSDDDMLGTSPRSVDLDGEDFMEGDAEILGEDLVEDPPEPDPGLAELRVRRCRRHELGEGPWDEPEEAGETTFGRTSIRLPLSQIE